MNEDDSKFARCIFNATKIDIQKFCLMTDFLIENIQKILRVLQSGEDIGQYFFENNEKSLFTMLIVKLYLMINFFFLNNCEKIFIDK